MDIDISIKNATVGEIQDLMNKLFPNHRKPPVVLHQPGPVQVKEPEIKPTNGRKEQPHTKLLRAVVSKYQIPFSALGPGKNEYQKALYLCKKHGTTYPEALKLELKADPSKLETPSHASLSHWQQKFIREYKGSAAGLVAKFRKNYPGRTINDRDIIWYWETTNPKNLSSPSEKQTVTEEMKHELKTITEKHFAVGDRIQCLEGHRELFTGVGIVKRINAKNGDLLVSFVNGMDWISANHVELAPPGARIK